MVSGVALASSTRCIALVVLAGGPSCWSAPRCWRPGSPTAASAPGEPRPRDGPRHRPGARTPPAQGLRRRGHRHRPLPRAEPRRRARQRRGCPLGGCPVRRHGGDLGRSSWPLVALLAGLQRAGRRAQRSASWWPWWASPSSLPSRWGMLAYLVAQVATSRASARRIVEFLATPPLVVVGDRGRARPATLAVDGSARVHSRACRSRPSRVDGCGDEPSSRRTRPR